jgi:hypothetical protein
MRPVLVYFGSVLSRGGGPLGDATCYLVVSPERCYLEFVWVADPSVPLSQRVCSESLSPRWVGGAQLVGLVPIRGWPHRVTGASDRFAGGDAFSVVKPSSGGEKCSLWASSSAGSAPPCSPARAPTVLSSRPPSCTGGAGRSVCSCRRRRDATVARAGGLHSGWNARVREWEWDHPPFPARSFFWKEK